MILKNYALIIKTKGSRGRNNYVIHGDVCIYIYIQPKNIFTYKETYLFMKQRLISKRNEIISTWGKNMFLLISTGLRNTYFYLAEKAYFCQAVKDIFYLTEKDIIILG